MGGSTNNYTIAPIPTPTPLYNSFNEDEPVIDLQNPSANSNNPSNEPYIPINETTKLILLCDIARAMVRCVSMLFSSLSDTDRWIFILPIGISP